MDQVHGVALDVEQVGDVVPAAAEGADLLADEGHGAVVVGLHQLLQALVVGIAGQIHVLALADGEGAVLGDGHHGLGEGGGAAVDHGHVLAVGVLEGAHAGHVVVAGDDHVDAGGVLDHVGHLVLLVELGGDLAHSALVPGAHGVAALAGVGGDDDEVALLGVPQLLLPVVHPLVGEGALRIVLVDEVGPVIVGGQVPIGHVHVLEAQDANLEVLAAHFEGHDLVGVHLGLLGGHVDIVGADDVHRVPGVLFGGVLQHVVEDLLGVLIEVELVVAQDEGVIPAVAQADRHGIVLAALHVHVVGDDGSALDDVAIVDEDGAVHLLTLLLHGGGHLQEAVVDLFAGDGV